ncbi:hypothetical protein PHMEG_00040015, partial [Phytophthora megakarya]
ILKDQLVWTPLLQHPDPGRQYVIILHANPWAISAVLGQDYDGTILPVRFVGRVLQDAELRYHPAEKEVLALLRVLNTCHTMITSCSEKKIRVYTRYSVLAWLFKSKTVDGSALNLSPWDLDIRRVENDEDGLAAILGAGITPRERLNEVAETLVPDKGSRIKTPPRDFNAAADYISKRVIQEQSSLEVTDLGERKLLQGLNRIHEKLMKDPSPREQSLVDPEHT